MIKFKQKEFWVGTAVTVGATALGLKQGSDAAEQNEELAEQQRRSDAKTRAALDRLAKSGASPDQKTEAASLFSDRQKLFAAAPGGFIKNVGGFAKDLWKHSGSGVKNAAKLGAGFAAAGYVGNKIASGLKNHDEGEDSKTVSGLAKVGAAAGTLAAGVWAARKGKFKDIPGLKGAQNFMTSGYGGRALKAGKSILQENVNPIKRKENGKLGINSSGALGLGFGMMPVVSYLAQRKSENDMAQSTEGQRQYGIPGVGMFKGAFKWAGDALRHLRKNPKQALSGGFNKVANQFGMMGSKGGTEATKQSFEHLGDIGKQSGNVYTQRLADWAKRHPLRANIAQGTAALAVGTTAMGVGEKIVTKPMKAIDRDAYKIEEQENDKI